MSESAAPSSAPAPAPAAASAPKYKEQTLRDLDPRIQRQIEAADKAIATNPGYAIEICSGVLSTNPGCIDARKILRKAQKKAAGPKPQKGMSKLFGGLTNTPFMMKSGSQLKSDPKGLMEAAEKLLAANPANVQALKMEAQAAAAMGLWGTAAFAYENIRDVEPENIENLMSYGNALVEAGRGKEAEKVGERILELSPGSGDAQALLRRASVSVTMDKGKWDEQSDFRSKLANKEQAIELEQQARLTNDADTLNALVIKLTEVVAKDPENINIYRDIIGYLKQLQRYDEALDWVRRARQLPLGRSDTTLEKLESDMTVARMRFKITELQEALAKNPDPAKQAELEAFQKSELEYRLTQTKAMVDKYPNDYGYRFDYGMLLLETGQVEQSIRELQLARRNPKVSHKAMLNLGRAYRAKGIFDLAIEQFNQAKTEMAMMSDLKKEIIYELASVYRQQRNVEKAVEEYKLIYANDIDYRDVAKIINEYYEKRTLD
jgi:tetratricopeptide (TPR) repeat protein